MKGSKRRYTEIECEAGWEVDFNVWLSNIVTLLCFGHRGGAVSAPLAKADIEKMLLQGLKSPSSWADAEHIVVQNAGKDNESRVVTFDARRKWQDVDNDVLDFMSLLMDDYHLVRDYGSCLAKLLLDSDYWTLTYDIMPSTGYAKPRMVFTQTPTNILTGVRNGWLKIPRPSDPWCMGIAFTLMAIDATRLSIDVIPPLEDQGADRASSQVMGALKSWLAQIRELHANPMFYLTQGPNLFHHLHRRWRTPVFEEAWRTNRNGRTKLETWAAMSEEIYAEPLHTLLRFIADCANSGTLDTIAGVKEIRWEWGGFVPYHSIELENPIPDLCRIHKSNLVQGVIEEAALDGRSPFETNGIACPAPLGWEFTDNVRVHSGGQQEPWTEPLSVGDWVRILGSTPKLKERITTVIGRLGNTSASSGWDVGEIDARGANFALTDGHGYSRSPEAMVLGLTPCLPVSNDLTLRLGQYFEYAWNVFYDENTEKRIEVWPIVVKGRYGAHALDAGYERSIIPAGMNMGERDLRRLSPKFQMKDGFAADILRYWVQKGAAANGFVDIGYGPPNIGDTNVRQSFWDPYVTGGDPRKIASEWGIAMKDYIRPAEEIAYVEPAPGDIFLHRIIVARSVRNEWKQYGERFSYIRPVVFTSVVDFDDSIDTSTPPSKLEQVIDYVNRPDSTGSPALDKTLQHEAGPAKEAE
jgi:hypothetical protein